MHVLFVAYGGGVSMGFYGPFSSSDDAETYVKRLRLADNATYRVIRLMSPDWSIQWHA